MLKEQEMYIKTDRPEGPQIHIKVQMIPFCIISGNDYTTDVTNIGK